MTPTAITAATATAAATTTTAAAAAAAAAAATATAAAAAAAAVAVAVAVASATTTTLTTITQLGFNPKNPHVPVIVSPNNLALMSNKMLIIFSLINYTFYLIQTIFPA